jgi:hypothetical protein
LLKEPRRMIFQKRNGALAAEGNLTLLDKRIYLQ